MKTIRTELVAEVTANAALNNSDLDFRILHLLKFQVHHMLTLVADDVTNNSLVATGILRN